MLHEREPAVLRLLHVIGLALVDIGGMDLLVLVLFAVNRESRKALGAESLGDGIALALRFAVVGKLEVGVCCNRIAAAVAHAHRYIDDVAIAPEGVDLLDLQAILAHGP